MTFAYGDQEGKPGNRQAGMADSFLSVIPDYSGDPYVAVNDNVPEFTDADLSVSSFETYSDLDFLGRCGVAYACIGTDLVEDTSVAPYEGGTEQIILFKWNRRYPADLLFDIDFAAGGWELSSAEDFPGNSH